MILALDVATKCGWALGPINGPVEAFGTWDFSLKRDESAGMRLVRFRAKLLEMLHIGKVTMVAFERTSGMHKGAIIVQSELHGVMKAVLEDQGVPYTAYSAPEIKKCATGKGNAAKAQMIEAAINEFGVGHKINDNEADALWILEKMKLDIKYASSKRSSKD